MHYQFWNESSSHPPLILLHGFLGRGQDFAGVIAQLGNSGSIPGPCLTLDLPGHGQTAWPGGFDLASTAAGIVELCDRLDLPPCTICGYSMGGRVALYLALTYPQRFPNAILESASPGLEDLQARQARQILDEQRARAIAANFEQFLADWYAQPLFASLRASPGFADLFQARSQNDPVGLGRSLRQLGLGSQPSLWQALSQHTQPILCLVGAQDHKFRAIAQSMAQVCSWVEVRVLPEAGHNIHWENPAAWVEAIQPWRSP